MNADDWALDSATTEAIRSCYLEGAVTSATAMVYMRDSRRAAGRRCNLPLGLHINLDTRFDGAGVPIDVMRRHGRVVDYFARVPASRWFPLPTLCDAIRQCVADQVEAFQDAYGIVPTHFDSHHHVHVSPTALIAGPVPSGSKVRLAFTRRPSTASRLAQAARVGVNALLRRRYRTTDDFFALAISGVVDARVLQWLRLAGVRDLEVMTHPGTASERSVLASPQWLRELARLSLGSYRDLTGKTVVHADG